MRVLLAAVIAGLWTSFRETLPSDESEAGIFLAGMTWAFVAFFSVLAFVTWLWAKAAGVAL
jgi:hypothetical protein